MISLRTERGIFGYVQQDINVYIPAQNVDFFFSKIFNSFPVSVQGGESLFYWTFVYTPAQNCVECIQHVIQPT